MLKVRSRNGARVIEGYAAVYYDGTEGTQFRSKRFPVVERLMRGAFSAEVVAKSDILLTFDHKHVLGRTGNDTGKVRADERGLWFEAQVNEKDPIATALAAQVERQDIAEASFGFDKEVINRRFENGILIREITHFGEIKDAGPVVDAAYKSTSISIRSEAELEAEFEKFMEIEHNRALEDIRNRFNFRARKK